MKYSEKKDIIEIAFDILAGYCKKHINCLYCRFSDKSGDCLFEKSLLPCDWQKQRSDNNEE